MEQGIRSYEAIALIATLILICSIDAITSKRCEEDITKLTSKIQSQLIKTIRNGAIQEVDTNELVVGDVFLIEPGMMVPADSILIQQTENPEEAKSPFIKDSDAEEPTSKAKKSTGFSKLNDIFKKAQKETK